MRLLRRLVLAVAIAGAAAAAGFWLLTIPRTVSAATSSALASGDPARGERMFWAGGCASCHARPDAKGDALLELAGGVELKTQFGTFVAPNISSDPKDGIGAWTVEDFANALLRGVSPNGRHYYPAFPYASYARMKPADVADLFAYLKTLPAVTGKPRGHSLAFPYSIRRGVGLWKLLYLDDKPVIALGNDASEQVLLGRYLVEGPGHCGECHTPRNAIGGPRYDQWLAGAVAAEGRGNVPNITGGEGGIGDWSASEIVELLATGFTPDFDSVGGSMADVQQNMARLSDADREAIAAYLKAAPPHPNGYPPREAARPEG